MLYLLHSDQPGDIAEHYIGITTPPRLQKRLMEHRSGRGAKWTSERHSAARPWHFVAAWPTNLASDEKRLQELPTLHLMCPRCMSYLTGDLQQPYTVGPEPAPTLQGGFPLFP